MAQIDQTMAAVANVWRLDNACGHQATRERMEYAALKLAMAYVQRKSLRPTPVCNQKLEDFISVVSAGLASIEILSFPTLSCHVY